MRGEVHVSTKNKNKWFPTNYMLKESRSHIIILCAPDYTVINGRNMWRAVL